MRKVGSSKLIEVGRCPKREPILNTSTRNQGLPAKSFMYVVSLDFYLRIGLSCLFNTQFFSNYLSSFVRWKFRYRDRERSALDYLNFMCSYNETGVDALSNSNFFKRTDAIRLLNRITRSVEKYKRIKSKHDLGVEEYKYLFKFNQKFGGYRNSILMSIPDICERINNIQSLLVKHYLFFIVKGLLEKRGRTSDVDKLKSDAYEVLMSMIDNYDPTRSKVPFSNYLKFFIRSGKDKVIKRETWNLKEGSLVFTDGEKTEKIIRKDAISEMVNKHLKRNSLGREYEMFMEDLSGFLPTPLYNILVLNFMIIDPLSSTEEVELVLG